MATLEEIFVKEFNQMMSQLRASAPQISLEAVPVPADLVDKNNVSEYEKAILFNIEDEYYGKLNETENIIWNKGALVRRKFDYRGEFITDKEGKYVTEDVILPHSCIAIISDTSIGVPNKYKIDEDFQYVDFISKENEDGTKTNKYIYIIPRKYCYKLSQTALVLSWNRLRTFYTGMRIALTNGNYVFVHTIPYKPTSGSRNYRVLKTKTSDDYTEELAVLTKAWVTNNIMFNPATCQIDEGIKGLTNTAYELLNSTIESFYAYDTTKTMADVKEVAEELDIF